MTAALQHRRRGPRKAVVHIGMAKTGTTSIQAWLYSNVPELSKQGIYFNRLPLTRARSMEHAEVVICQFAEAGVLVPNSRLRYIFGIKSLAEQDAVAERYSKRFASALSRSREETVILSVEDVGGLTRTKGQAKALERWLGRFFDEVRYVVYFRRQEDWLISAYSQMIKTGGSMTLDEFFEKRKDRDYLRRLNAWLEVFGRERLSVRLLERDALRDGDLIADFAHEAGIDPAPMRTVPRRNESLTRASGEYLRVLNAKLREEGAEDPVNETIYGGLVPFLGKTFADAEKFRLTQPQIDEIRTINAECNEWMREKFFPDRAELFPAKPPAPDVLPPVSAEDIARVGIAVMEAKLNGQLRPKRDIRNAPGLHQKAWRRIKERHPTIASRIGPLFGRKVDP